MLQIGVANVSEVKAAGLPACKAPPVLADSGPVAGQSCRYLVQFIYRCRLAAGIWPFGRV